VKLESRQIEAFLADPTAVRAVLLFGDDAGLIAERAVRLTRRVAGELGDPFRTVELERGELRRIGEEMAALPMTGGRRVVRVRDASDALAGPVETALAARLPGFLVLEALGLPGRSRLRAIIEKSPEAVALGCYAADAAQLGRAIRTGLREGGVRPDDAALAWLEDRLGADVVATRGEVEKLVLYVGQGGIVDLPAAQACVGDLAGLSLEDALFAATEGDVAAADRALELALGEGLAPVAVLRAALLHVQRLHRAQLAVGGGLAPSEAAKAARPPLFFRREAAFLRALQRWPEPRLAAAATALAAAERAAKRTGAPAEWLCRNAIIGLGLRTGSRRVR
jgi:DNA polymerase-3 subunit delta